MMQRVLLATLVTVLVVAPVVGQEKPAGKINPKDLDLDKLANDSYVRTSDEIKAAQAFEYKGLDFKTSWVQFSRTGRCAPLNWKTSGPLTGYGATYVLREGFDMYWSKKGQLGCVVLPVDSSLSKRDPREVMAEIIEKYGPPVTQKTGDLVFGRGGTAKGEAVSYRWTFPKEVDRVMCVDCLWFKNSPKPTIKMRVARNSFPIDSVEIYAGHKVKDKK